LIAEDQEEAAHGALAWRRQASEQYLTASQLARHFLRQTMGRPQALQVFVGKVDLFPRKSIVGSLTVGMMHPPMVIGLPPEDHPVALQPGTATCYPLAFVSPGAFRPPLKGESGRRCDSATCPTL